MPFTPYTLQTILPSVTSSVTSTTPTSNNTTPSEEHQQQQPSPPTSLSSSPAQSSSAGSSFFSRRLPGSPPSSDVSKSLPASPSRLNNLLSGQQQQAFANVTPFSIDAAEAWDTNLYLGTSDGQVLHFTLEEHGKAQEVPYASQLENKINLGFGRKPVERILILPQVSKAVVLCDSTLSFYSLPFFDPIPVSLIPQIKGVACFSHDVAEEGRIGEDGTIELCIVKRRVLQILKIGELVQMKKELPLPDGAIAIVRHSRNLCLADIQNYKLINLQLPNPTPLIPTPQVDISSSPPSMTTSMLSTGSQKVPRPVLTVIKQDEFLVVSGNVSPNNDTTIGIFADSQGSPIRGTLQWSSYPKALCVEYPYIGALLRNNTIEIHNILDQKLLQTIRLDPSFEPRGMSFGHGIRVWMEGMAQRLSRRPWSSSVNKEGKDEDEEELRLQLRRQVARFSTVPARILVYGRESVMAQIVTPLVVQVDALLDTKNFEEALDMADQARNTLSAENNTHVERMQSELDYIYQKAGLLLLQETLFEDAFALLSKGNLDPRVVIYLFGDLSQCSWLAETPSVLLFDGIRSLLDTVGKIEDVVARTMKKNYSPHLEEDDHQQRSSPTMEMRKVLLKNAREALERYLTVERGKHRTLIGKGNAVCKAMDTALLKLYVGAGEDQSIYTLLQRPNDCSLEECANTLNRSKRYYALSVLYQSKQLYEKVLEIWTKIYSGELPDTQFTDGLGQIKRLLLRDINDDSQLSLTTIVKYTWWLMDNAPHDGVEVFIRSPRANEMDTDNILGKLKKYGNEAVRTYLEYLVLTRESEQAIHHTRLACSYVRDVKLELQNVQGEEMQKLVDGFKQSIHPAEIGGHDQTFVAYLGRHQQTELIRRRLLLIRLLQRSSLYDPEVLFQEISEAGSLKIEIVILYGRMKKHEEALQILIHELEDFVGAETYCVTNGQSTGAVPDIISVQGPVVTPARTSSLNHHKEKERSLKKKKKKADKKPKSLSSLTHEQVSQQLNERRQLFSMLLKTYLAIKERQLMLVRTMHLLTTQGYYLDILETLQLIPDDWPIQTLQDFLVHSLRRSLQEKREGEIVVGLSRGENLMVGGQLIDIYKDIGPTYVDSQSECQRCHRYLGINIVVRDHKNGHLLHLQCAKASGLIIPNDNTTTSISTTNTNTT
ncbi:hypothetical protein BDC45DRAFT_542029 [Circinella umbellata]|nr:hypothetical protein BDC45DRAFT_542029 [Circinella umbellata]